MGRARALALALATIGCARNQLVVTVSSDLLTPAMVEADDTLSGAAAIERVRVESINTAFEVVDSNEFLVDQAGDLPLSFGAVADVLGTVELEVIAFNLRWTIDKDGVTQPLPGVSVDRLLRLEVSSFQRVNLTLTGDCFAHPADRRAVSLISMTCVDADNLDVFASTVSKSPAIEGSWPRARAVPCPSEAPSGTICIPGGASIIGDPQLVTVDANSDLVPASPRMVVVSPFFMDREEMTVAGLRALVAAKKIPAFPESCNYTSAPGPTDQQAVRCVPYMVARMACQSQGGNLPSEAQWEHAARGRGRESRYPWGDDTPTCCAAALAGNFGCQPKLDVGSYTSPDSCNGIADVSRDGVYDLAGGVREWVLDADSDYDTCIGPGVLVDPVCLASSGTLKGGSYVTKLEDATAALRRKSGALDDVGFRCVRPAE